MAVKRKRKKFTSQTFSSSTSRHAATSDVQQVTTGSGKPEHSQEVLTITDLSRSGSGVGHDQSGRAVFVPYTAPGDVVRVKLQKQKRNFAEAKLIEIIEASPIRVTPRCLVYTQCGGCQLQHLPYEMQWQMKLEGVRESLRRARVNEPEDWINYPAHQTWEYRNRIQLRGNKRVLGFFARNSNTLIPIQRCEIVDPMINQALDSVREEARHFTKPFKVEIGISSDGSVQRSWNQEHAASGFRQVNDEQNRNLQQWIKKIVTAIPRKKLIDLYGGSGNLSLPLVDYADEIHCIDTNINVPEETRQSLPGYFYFHQSNVLDWLQQRVKAIQQNRFRLNGEPWLAVCDPPRAGLGHDATAMISALHHHHVDTLLWIGCKTDAWSRDLATCLQYGWKLEKVAVLDFFPQTYHVETAAVLRRPL